MAGDPDAAVPLARLAEHERLFVRAVFTAPGATFPFGAHVAVAEVDTETGKAVLRRVVTVDDAGTVMNPLLAEGQRHGGIAQGAAQALLEEVVYDADGNPLTSSFADYAIVTATEVPTFELADMETPTSYNPLGAKGIGEAGTIGSTPAVQNAIVDAVAHLGVRHIDMPASPQRVWQALRAASAGPRPRARLGCCFGAGSGSGSLRLRSGFRTATSVTPASPVTDNSCPRAARRGVHDREQFAVHLRPELLTIMKGALSRELAEQPPGWCGQRGETCPRGTHRSGYGSASVG